MEKIDDIQEEEFVKQKYARDDEAPVPWSIENLNGSPSTGRSPALFYELKKFSVFKKVFKLNGLRFPEYLMVSSNHYHMQWTMDKTLRRLKNVIVVMEWSPNALQGHTIATKALSNTVDDVKEWSLSDAPNADVDNALRRCFTLFDTDSDGILSNDDVSRVSGRSISSFFYDSAL